MHSIKTRGIVIKRVNFGEADRILTVFTERLGKIKVLAKGVRKITSKIAGSLEPYNLLDLELHQGKTFYTVTSVQIAECLDCDGKIGTSSRAVYLAEIIDKLFQEDEKNIRAFEIFTNCLRSIGSSNELLLRLFELQILEEAGFKPDLFYCSKCKERLKAGGNFVNQSGDLLCPNCADALSENVPDDVIKILRLLQQRGVEVCQQIRCGGPDMVIAEKYINQLLQNALERELKSKKYL